MDKSFDTEFAKIEGLKWLPWVGSDYSKDENPKLLIIGETHYHNNSEWSIGQHNKIDFTRLIVNEMGIQKLIYGKIKMFTNLHKVIFNNSPFESSKFWNFVSFYNLVQRPMVTINNRPNHKDFSYSWPIFFELIKVLKPRVCLLIGVTSSHTLSEAIEKSTFRKTDAKWEEKISNVEPIIISLVDDMDNYEVRLIFIRHASRGFSWSKWHQFLKSKMPETLNSLSEKSK